jgi:16S rRNA (adenine1518-N6/adenine1519-N6)-dimethyltransferase
VTAHVARKRFGQHFLQDASVLERIVDAINPARLDVLLEIGPGEGALTRLLLERVESMEAIEIDRDLAARLEAELPRERLLVHCGDALEFDFGSLPAGLRIVGNLPYNISTPLLFHIAQFSEQLRDLYFMLQLEVVERMVAPPSTPEYGRLSVMLQTRFRMEKLFHVGPEAFRPPPKVESAVVRMVPLAASERASVDERLFADIVRRAFSARRKTLRNAIGLKTGEFEALGIDPALRPENLPPADYLRIARFVAERE